MIRNIKRKFTSPKSFSTKAMFVLIGFHISFIFVFDKVTAFAPDEENYIRIFNNLYKSTFSLQGYLGWQEGSVNILRIIYLPAKVLETIGFSDFYSVRLLSASYSIATMIILVNSASDLKVLGRSVKVWIVLAFFIPTIFLWSSLGLRESFIFFSIASTFYLLRKVEDHYSKKGATLLIIISVFFLISKLYLYGLFLICLAMSGIVLSILRRKLEAKHLRILTATLVPLLLFPMITTNIVTGAASTLQTKLIDSNPSPTLNPSPAPINFPEGQTVKDISSQLDKNPQLLWFSSLFGIDTFFASRVNNSSSGDGDKNQLHDSQKRKPREVSLRDPVSLWQSAFKFLFIPAPFIDNGSFFLNAQSFESFIWYLYYVLLGVLLVGIGKSRYLLNLQTLTIIFFTLGFVLISSLIEVNIGTAVRHRSVLLMCILVMLSSFRTKERRLNSD